MFELSYILLGNGPGPENRGLTVMMYLYQTGFLTGDLGYASAIGWVLALTLMGIALFQRRLARRFENR
jgi:ABC-type sugar transport system permease subunit